MKIYKKYLVIVVTILFIGASIVPTLAQPLDNYYATADIPVLGEVINDYTYTVDSDNQYESITEVPMGKGKPINRYNALEHKWTINVSEEYDCYVFYIEAYHTPNAQPEHFVFAYSLDNETYTDMLTVTKTADDDVCQKSFPLSDSLFGTVYVRVRDTGRGFHEASWNDDTIYIDRMYFAADTTPPVILHVASTTNDNTWNKKNPNVVGGTLYERERFDMAYDSNADRTIMFGGGGDHRYNDTWAYDFNTNTWTNMSALTTYSEVGGPLTARIDHSMCYDSDANRVIMFGGNPSGAQRAKDTWAYEFNTNTWTNMSALTTYSEVGGTLSPRCLMRMVYDSFAQQVIMFGGYDGDGVNETWVYNSNENTWYKMSPETVGGTLNGTWAYGMAYDSSADRTIMFGGIHEEGDRWTNETWVYDYNENKWYKMNPEIVGGTLYSRIAHVMVYENDAYRTILFGGQKDGGDQLNDNWVYNYCDNKWCKVNPEMAGGTLWPREASGIVYDSTNKRTILFGGWCYESIYTWGNRNDTWIYNINDISVTITWTTDEPSDSEVHYGKTTALGNTASDTGLVTNHKIVITGLEPGTAYYYELQSTDPSGNTAVDNNNGAYYTITTSTPDTTPPVITNVATSDFTYNSATITWTTDEPSNTVVHYGITTNLGSTKQKPALETSHSSALTNLLPETTYYYEVQSTDIKGNTAVDNNNGEYYIFTTGQVPSNIMHVYSIDMWYEPVKNRYNIYTKVKIVDASDNAVEGATVYLETTLPNGDTISADDITDSTGFVTFIYGPTPKSGTYISTVTNVAKDDWTYNPDDNVETSETLSVP